MSQTQFQPPEYVVTTTPHIRDSITIEKTMQMVTLALMPATAMGVVFFGLRALLIIAISVASAALSEYAYQKIAKKKVTVTDGSAALTGLLLALVLPPAIPLWMPVLGAACAIVLAKQLFGGLGHNFINPALAGRAVLVAAYAMPMTTGFIEPGGPFLNLGGADVTAAATPLAGLAYNVLPQGRDYFQALVGNIGGSIGETSAIALLAGGAFLLAMRVISWHIPASFVGTVFALAAVFGPVDLALYHVLTGGLLLGAFFMATDYPTSPISPVGKLVFGAGCGLLTFIIRFEGGYPEGVAYAILLMNLTVPLIDRYIRPRVFGHRKTKRDKKGASA